MLQNGLSEAEAKCSIFYTSSDSNIVTPYDTSCFGAKIVSNTYKNGMGVIKFGGNVTSIGEEAFRYCTSLTSITIPEGVTSIGNGAFANCSALASITIPNSVTLIEYLAFYDCTSLRTVYCKATKVPSYGTVSLSFLSLNKIYVPMESVDKYKAADGWKDYSDKIVGYNFEE